MLLYDLKKNSINNTMLGIGFALFAFLRLGPYFTWSTYRSGLFSSLYIFDFLLVFFLFVIMNIRDRNKLVVSLNDSYYVFAALVISVFLIGICGFKISNFVSAEWIVYGCFILFILVPDECKIKSYKYYKIIFAVTLIPAIVYYVMNVIGCGGIIPYDILKSGESIKVLHGSYYIHYPFAIQIAGSSTSVLSSLRLCGIYDEAGRLGTMAGLFLVAERFKLKDNFWNIIILIAGLLSFSLAFYLIVIIYFLVSNLIEGRPKNVLILLMIMLVYVVFMNMNLNNSLLASIQSRMELTSEGLVGDNRTNEKFNTVFAEYLDGGVFNFLFGYGSGAIQLIQQQRNIDGSSYKCYLYNYGVLGFGSTIVWTISYVLKKANIKLRYLLAGKSKECIYIITLVLVFVINLYQRPSVFHMSYMLIVIGGSLSILNKR